METKEKLQQPSDQIIQSQSLQYPDELPPPYAEVQPAVNPYLYRYNICFKHAYKSRYKNASYLL